MSVSMMLKGHDLFKALPIEEVDRINSFSSLKSFAKGEVVYPCEGFASHVFVLVEGQVALKLPPKAGQASLVVARAEKGELFGLVPLLDLNRYTVTAECVEASSVLAVEAAPLLEVLKRHPAVAHTVMTAVAKAYYTRYVESLRLLQNSMGRLD